MPSLERLVPVARLGGLGAVVIASVCALWFHARLPGLLPSSEDQVAAARALESARQPGDAVLLFPWWTERARLTVPPEVPVVGYLGSDADPLEDHPRIWVLGQPSLPRVDHAGFHKAFSPERQALGAPLRFGPLELTLYQNGRYRPSTFTTEQAPAETARRVYVEQKDGTRSECAWDGTAHRCGEAFVTGPEWHEVFYRPLRCLYARPPPRGARLVVEYPNAKLAERLSLDAGIIWEYAPRRGTGQTSARIGVESLAGQPWLGLEIPPGDEGLKRQTRALEATDGPGLRVWVQADSPQDREVCVRVKTQQMEAPRPPWPTTGSAAQ